MSDIHALIDCLDLCEQTGVVAQAVLADGKVDWRDMTKLIALWQPAKKAISELRELPVEVQNLNAEDAKVLIDKVMKVAQAWVDVFEHPAT